MRASSGAARWAAAALLVAVHGQAQAAALPSTDASAAHTSARPQAAARRVTLLALSGPLARALHAALVPWGMRLEVVARDAPEPSIPGGALRARELAAELRADVLVWVSESAESSALWIYEAADDSIRARTFAALPVDEARAAALALSVKTWLRLAAEPVPHARPVPGEPARPPPLPPPLFASAGAERDVQPRSEIPQPMPTRDTRTRLLLNAAARGGALSPTRLEARYGLELRALAWRSAEHARRVWLAAHLDTGRPATVSAASFRGEHLRWTSGISAGVGQRVAASLYLNVLGGLTLDRTLLSGRLLPEATAVQRSRWQAVAQLRPELELQLAPLALVLQPTLCASPRQQRFLVDGSEVLRTSAFFWTLGGALSLDLF